MSVSTQTTPTPNLGTLAQMVGCLDEEGVATLAGVKLGTLEAWRKRGTGPAHVRLGSNYLYPIEALQAFIIGKVKTSMAINPQSLVY